MREAINPPTTWWSSSHIVPSCRRILGASVKELCVMSDKFSAMREATRTFSAEAENVRAARGFVSETAAKWKLGESAWPLVQIVSELASNAIIHAGTDFTVHLTHDGEVTRIEVVDHSARRAQSRGYDLDATTGRGLRLVEMLSREWGVSSKGKDKTVWAVVEAVSTLDAEPDALVELFMGEGDDIEVAPKRGAKSRGGSPRASTQRIAS
jgi:anti-sigma regulatory factor (Ser/Thr protein kinase)